MHRFFLGEGDLARVSVGEILHLPSVIAHQIWRVLRLAEGEQLLLLDNSGDELLCTIVSSTRTGVEVEVCERRNGQGAGHLAVTLYQGLLKSARFEWILEKGTELGVTTFAPMSCRRSLSGLEEAGPAKVQRWQRIIQEATEQCGRARKPELAAIRPLATLIEELPAGTVAIMPWEEERHLHIRDVLRAEDLQQRSASSEHVNVALFIGPEGGFSSDEVELARNAGVRIVTLGRRILRAETAALATVAHTMYELEK